MSIVPRLGFVSAHEVREAALTEPERARLRRRVGLSTQQQNAARVERAYHRALGIDRPLSPAIRDSECAIVYNRRSAFGPHLWFMVRIDPMPGALASHAGWIGLTAASPALIGVSVLREHLQALLSQEAVPVLVEAIHTARWSTRAYDSRDAAKSKIRVGQCEAQPQPHRRATRSLAWRLHGPWRRHGHRRQPHVHRRGREPLHQQCQQLGGVHDSSGLAGSLQGSRCTLGHSRRRR